MINNSLLKSLWNNEKLKKVLIKGEVLLFLGTLISFVQYYCLAMVINLLQFGIKVSTIIAGVFFIILSVIIIYIGKKSLITVVTIYERDNRNRLALQLNGVKSDEELKVFFDVTTRGIFNLSSKIQWLIEKWPLIFIEGIVAIIFAAWINWKLACIYLLGLLIIQGVSFKLGKYYLKKLKMYRDIFSDHEFNVAEKNDNRECLIGEGYGQQFENELIDEEKRLMSYKWKIEIINQLYETLKNYSNMIYIVIYYIIGGYFILKGEVSIGALVSFNIYSESIKVLFSSIITYQENNIDCNLELSNLDKIFKAKENELNEEGISDKEVDAIIMSNVSYLKEKKKIINDVNLRINSGEKICIVGKNGMGKSTLAKILSGVYKDYEGDISIVHNNTVRERRKSDIQYIDQKVLFLNETVLKNMQYASVFEEEESYDTIKNLVIRKKADNLFAEEIIRKEERFLEEGEASISGGEAKVLSVLRGLLARKKIVIFDEPTEGLDAKKVDMFIDLLTSMEETCIVITHDMRVCKKVEHILIMENGMIKEQGTHKELLEKSEVYNSLI